MLRCYIRKLNGDIEEVVPDQALTFYASGMVKIVGADMTYFVYRENLEIFADYEDELDEII